MSKKPLYDMKRLIKAIQTTIESYPKEPNYDDILCTIYEQVITTESIIDAEKKASERAERQIEELIYKPLENNQDKLFETKSAINDKVSAAAKFFFRIGFKYATVLILGGGSDE